MINTCTVNIKSSSSYLFELQFRVDPHIADLTVEGSFLSVGVHWPPSLLSTGFGA